MNSFWMPKKQPLYAPMLSTFGGGSARGFRPGISTGGDPPLQFTSISFSNVSSGSDSGSTIDSLLGHTLSQDGNWVYAPNYSSSTFYWAQCPSPFTFPASSSDYSSSQNIDGYVPNNPSGVWVSRDGSRMAIQNRGNLDVASFSLSTPFDPASASRITTVDANTLISSRGSPNGCHFSEDGSRFAYFTQQTDDSYVDIFNCTTPFIPYGNPISSKKLDQYNVPTPGSLNMLGGSIDPSGEWLFVSNHNESHGSNPNFYYAKMSTAYDLSTLGSFSSFAYGSYVQNDRGEGSSNTVVAYPEAGKISTSGYSTGHLQLINGVVFS
jgi:hypothetical protein